MLLKSISSCFPWLFGTNRHFPVIYQEFIEFICNKRKKSWFSYIFQFIQECFDGFGAWFGESDNASAKKKKVDRYHLFVLALRISKKKMFERGNYFGLSAKSASIKQIASSFNIVLIAASVCFHTSSKWLPFNGSRIALVKHLIVSIVFCTES